MTRQDVSLISVIDLDSSIEPAVLAGILGISVPMIYASRKEGKLPGDTRASYRTCIQHYVAWHKQRSNLKAGNIMEKKLLQDIRNGIAKEEMLWLSIKEQRGLFLEKVELEGVIGPIFHLLRSGLVNLARKNPDVTEVIDKLLRSWSSLGEAMVTRANSDADIYVTDMITREIDLDGEEEDLVDLNDVMQAANDERDVN